MTTQDNEVGTNPQPEAQRNTVSPVKPIPLYTIDEIGRDMARAAHIAMCASVIVAAITAVIVFFAFVRLLGGAQ